MRVQVLHDRFIRLEVVSGFAPSAHVRVDKQHVTVMGKGVGSTWSAESATVNLSSHPCVDVVLYSTSPHQHCVVVSSVVDAHTVEALHQVVLDGRHMASSVLSDEHFVRGAEAIAKHLIAKHICIPALRCAPLAMHPYTKQGECEARFQRALMRSERARQHRGAATCKVKTVGSQAFRLFQRFNTTSTSKITSAFPAHSLAFAQSVCLAAGFLANTTSGPRAGVLLAHSLQLLAVSAEASAHLRVLADTTLRASSEAAPADRSLQDVSAALAAVAEADAISDTDAVDAAPAAATADAAWDDDDADSEASTVDAAWDSDAASDADTLEANSASEADPADASWDTDADADAAVPDAGQKLGRLSMLLDSGVVYTTPFVTLGREPCRLLEASGVGARSETPMYMSSTASATPCSLPTLPCTRARCSARPPSPSGAARPLRPPSTARPPSAARPSRPSPTCTLST